MPVAGAGGNIGRAVRSDSAHAIMEILANRDACGGRWPVPRTVGGRLRAAVLGTALLLATCAGTAAGAEPAHPANGLSGRIAAAVREGLPEFAPVKERPPEPAVAGDEDVVLMPKMIVRERKVPRLVPRELLTKDGLAAELRKRYPGASLPGQDPLDSTIPNYAALQLREDERRAALSEWNDIAARVGRAAGREAGGRLRSEIEGAFRRRPDALTEAMDKSANNGRR